MAGQHFKTVKLSTILVTTAPCEHLTISSLGKLAFLVACGFYNYSTRVMSDVSTNFAGKPTHHLFGFAAGKCCRLCRFLRDGSVKTRKSSGPLTTSNPAHGLNINISLHWSIFFHILKMLAFFLRVNTLRSQLQKMPSKPLIIF